MTSTWLTRILILLLVSPLALRPLSAQSGASAGVREYAMYCAGCHGADGSGGGPKGPAIATLPAAIALPDSALIKIVHDGIPGKGMPGLAFIGDQNIVDVVGHLRTLQGVKSAAATSPALTGEAIAGRAVYFGKGHCSSCHMVSGEGGFIASDLTAYGQRRDASDILEAIVKPDAQLAPASRVVEVRTQDGQSLAGVVRYEDNMNLGLQTLDGRYHFLTRSGLADVNYTDHSLMPHDYGTRLTIRELDDVVSFLIVSGKNAPAEASPARRGRRNGGN